MKKNKVIVLILLTILLSFCNNSARESKTIYIDDSQKEANLEFSLVKETEIEDLLYPMLAVKDKFIYIYGIRTIKKKKNLNQIKYNGIDIFNLDLEFIKSKKLFVGQGPGDLYTGPIMFFKDNNIVISDHTQRRVSIFDKDFNYKNLVKINQKINFINIAADSNFNHLIFCKTKYLNLNKWDSEIKKEFYISTFPGQSRKKFLEIGPYSWLTYKSGIPKMMINNKLTFHYFINDRIIYFLNGTDYELYKFNLNGHMIKKVKINFKTIPVPADKKEDWLKYHIKQLNERTKKRIELGDVVYPATLMVKLGKGLVVIRRKDYILECNGFAQGDYFDFELNLIGKVSIPCFWRIYMLPSSFFPNTCKYYNGYLYLIQEINERFVLQKWKVEE